MDKRFIHFRTFDQYVIISELYNIFEAIDMVLSPALAILKVLSVNLFYYICRKTVYSNVLSFCFNKLKCTFVILSVLFKYISVCKLVFCLLEKKRN